MVNIQNWINENYSDLQIEEIYNRGQELQGNLIIENYPNLKKIILTNAKQITKLVVHNCPAVERIDIYNSKISDLDISELANLEYLQVGNNQLTKLNVSQNKKLKTLICFNNPLESLEGVDKLTELSYFNASNAWRINNNLVNQANLSSDYSYWPAEIQQKRKELENLRTVFEESVSLLNGEIQSLEKNRVQTLENKIKELELKEVNYQGQIQDLEREKRENLQEINDLSRKKGELEREISELKNNLSEAKEKIKKLESDLEKEKSDYRKQVGKKDKEIRELISDKEVEKKIKEITKWTKKEKNNQSLSERLEAHVMITPKSGYYIKK